MRPRPIIWFERVVLLAYALGIANLSLAQDSFPPTPWLTHLIYFGAYALLIWLVSRKGSAVGRGIFAALTVLIGFVYLATLPAASDMSAETALGAAQCLLTLASLGLIFGRETEPWFRGERPIDPDIFA